MNVPEFIERSLLWESTGDAITPCRVSVDGLLLTVQVGDFPDESQYTLFVDGEPLAQLDDWPASWQRAAPAEPRLVRRAPPGSRFD